MKILALDGATEACSVALLHDGEYRTRFEIAPRRHAELLMPMAKSLLAEASVSLCALDALAFGRGPGAFTGLRIVTGLVQGLALGSDLPVAPVSDLAATAARAMRLHAARAVLSVHDARMREVYWCGFLRDENGEPEPTTAEQVAAPEKLPAPAAIMATAPAGQWRAAGNGWPEYAEKLAAWSQAFGAPLTLHPHAEEIARLANGLAERGQLLDPALAAPCYVRNQVAHKPQHAGRKREQKD